MNTQKLLVYLRVHELDFITAALIALVGFILSKYIKKILLKSILSRPGDHTVKYFVVNLCYVFILAILSIMVLNKLGVQTASLITVLGASSLAIALSLKDSLSNVAAGVLLIFQKPFKIGDVVTIDSITGTVKMISIYNIVLVAGTNDQISMPNSKVINEKIINHTNHEKRKLVIPVYVSYKENIENVKHYLIELFSADSVALKDPGVTVIVNDLDTTGVLLNINVWVKTIDYNTFKPNALESVTQVLAQNNINYVTLNTSTN